MIESYEVQRTWNQVPRSGSRHAKNDCFIVVDRAGSGYENTLKQYDLNKCAED